jgi:hypothetical protein
MSLEAKIMSIISFQLNDKSNFLCKRYASLASDYFDHPDDARKETARIPLENLFRVLEMYRNNTFLDENRTGVLALETQEPVSPFVEHNETWHTDIKRAVQNSLHAVFGADASEVEATIELQSALRWLAVNGTPRDENIVGRAKTFFSQLSGAL